MKQDGDKLAVVGLSCETDFVSLNEDFIKAVDNYAAELATKGEAEFKTWAEGNIKNELVVKIGENIQLTTAKVFDAAGVVLGKYIHSNKKIASVVVLTGGNEELANDIAMQIAAMSPEYLNPESVPAEITDKEKEIYAEQLKAEGKPEEMIEKILQGKINKFYEDVCLVKQKFIKDDKMTIEQLLQQAGDGIEIKEYSLLKI